MRQSVAVEMVVLAGGGEEGSGPAPKQWDGRWSGEEQEEEEEEEGEEEGRWVGVRGVKDGVTGSRETGRQKGERKKTPAP